MIRTGSIRGFFPGATSDQHAAMHVELLRHAHHAERFVDSTWRRFGVEADFDRLKLLARYVQGLSMNRRLLSRVDREFELERWPAGELVGRRAAPAPDRWRRLWASHGHGPVDGRLIARWDEPIWRASSLIGIPFPPFDPELDADWRYVSRADARRLGVTKPWSINGAPLMPQITVQHVESCLVAYFEGRDQDPGDGAIECP